MISPPDYYPVSALARYIENEMRDSAIEYLLKPPINPFKLILRRADDLIYDRIMDYCSGDLFLTDGLQDVVRIDPALLKEAVFWVDLSIREDPDTYSMMPTKLRQDFHMCNPLPLELVDQFSDLLERHRDASDEEKDRIDGALLEMAWEATEDYGRTVVSWFVNTETYSISMDLHRFFLDQKQSIQDAHSLSDRLGKASILNRFDGYFLCTTSARAKDSEALAELLKKPFSDPWGPQEDRRATAKGRPLLQGEAVRLFNERYPTGLNEVTLAEAARVLGYDRKTLRAGLTAAGQIGPKMGN